MHNVLENIKENIEIDLDTEYSEALKDPNVKAIVKSLKIKDDELKKYTTLIKESACEYEHCKNCKSLLDCKNKVEGYCNLPINVDGNIAFTYKPCKYKENLDKKNKFLDNVKYFNTPDYLKEACLDNIYKTDKNRLETINYLLDFLDDYEAGKNPKGLYLHGNFGCGKTYLIAAIFNELAKKGYKSSIVFYPEFLRQVFYDDFKEKFEYVKKVPLLLLDDIGAEGLTAWNRDEVLCPLLQYRMDNMLPTFFTSNLTIEELERHLRGTNQYSDDEIKARRIIERINQLTEDMEMISENKRK
jgi:primosomal protein DnaI